MTFSYESGSSGLPGTEVTTTQSGSYSTPWVTIGGDYHTDDSSSFTQTFDSGTEDLEIDITTIHDWEEKQKKYKDELEKNVSFKKLMDGVPGKYLRFKAQEWMPFSDHILSVLKKVFTEE